MDPSTARSEPGREPLEGRESQVLGPVGPALLKVVGKAKVTLDGVSEDSEK